MTQTFSTDEDNWQGVDEQLDSILLKEIKTSCTNIVDPSKLIKGLLYPNGTNSGSDTYRNTDYIPVNGQSVRIKNPANLGNSRYPNWCVYDSSKQFLRCAQRDSEPYDYQSGDYYIKICFNTFLNGKDIPTFLYT